MIPWTAAHQAPLSSLTARVCSNSWPLSRWCCLISFSFGLQSFPASESFSVSPLFTSGGQSIWASASVLPVNIEGWFLLGLIDLTSLQSKGLSSVFSSTTIWKPQFFGTQHSLPSHSNAYYPSQFVTGALFLLLEDEWEWQVRVTGIQLPRVFSSVQFSSVTQSCPTLFDPMNCSTPGLPVHHQLLEFTQTHVHGVGNAIQPSHPLSSPSSPAPNSSQHQGLFQWVNSLSEEAKVLDFQLQQ